MRDAETVLAIIRERGRKGLPLEDLYRTLYNRELFLRAYAKLYPNPGAMTPGSSPETVDGMSLDKIDRLIADLRAERYHWSPVRRVHIPKPNGKSRPLGIPSWSDKLLQEVLRLILEAYYEPQFADASHGFRPNRGCHTALRTIQQQWTGTAWFIEGDIAQYFDTIDHDILLGILREKIHDNRFLLLVKRLLQAGYAEQWTYHPTPSGTPQGGVISPLLANIYLDRFDQFVTRVLIPANTRGDRRGESPVYTYLTYRISRLKLQGERAAVKALRQQRRTIPSVDLADTAYRRLRYVRYADDFVLGFTGPRVEAEAIKQQLTDWLNITLKLTLSAEKTLITSATKSAARFLGYDIINQQANDRICPLNGKRTLNGCIGLRVPYEVIERKCARYSQRGKPIHRREFVDVSDFSIVARYQQEYRGIVQYYLLASNVCKLSKLRWVMETSLLKTLANKYRRSVAEMVQQYTTTVQTPMGDRKALEVRVERDGRPPLVARFGGIPLVRQPQAVLRDTPTPKDVPRTEILKRLLANACELCGSTENVEVHHLRKLSDLDQRGKRNKAHWMKVMASRRRKTLVVCRICHDAIHAGRPTRQKASE